MNQDETASQISSHTPQPPHRSMLSLAENRYDHRWDVEAMLSRCFLLASALAFASGYVEEYVISTTTPPPPPRPYYFSWNAERYPGYVDRQQTEVSDGNIVKGQFSYIDPRQKVHQVDYVADKDGFHPIVNDAPPEHPSDSRAVAEAREKHLQLYAQIAQEHAQHPHPEVGEITVPRQSQAVQAAAAKHMALFKVIAEQHARIAEERERLQREEEERQHLQELGSVEPQNYDPSYQQ